MCAVCPLRACLTVGRCHHHTPRHLHKLPYPAVSGNRKYRAKQEAEQMSTAQIDHILKANEYSHAFPRGPASHGAQGFHSNLLSANQPCEDSRSSASCLVDGHRSVGGGALLFGVFDGHAGAACAKAVSHRLFYYIATATLPLKTLQEIESAVEEARPVPPLLEFHQQLREEQRCGAQQPLMFSSRLRMFWQDLLQEAQEDTTALLDTEGSNVSSALEEAFMRLDNDLSMEAQLDLATSSPRRVPNPGDSHSLSSPLRVALSGSTACVAHLSQGVLHVANLGDSRALLGVQESDGRWSALPLTQDHTAHNPDELHRILGEHPRSERRTVVRHDRLLGMLMPLRAFGDVRFKWSKETLGRMYESSRPEVVAAAMNMALRRTMTQNYHTPPYLTAHPEVATHRLRPQDKFLIMATDGLWDLMHRHTAVQLVGEHLTGLRWQRPLSPNPGTTLGSLQSLLLERKGRGLSTVADLNSATHLLRHALGNDGYGGVEPRRLDKMLRLSPNHSRMYRDDITITVIHLNEPDVL